MTVEIISWDQTRNPWIYSQTRICCQTRYRLRYNTGNQNPMISRYGWEVGVSGYLFSITDHL